MATSKKALTCLAERASMKLFEHIEKILYKQHKDENDETNNDNNRKKLIRNPI